MPEGVQEKLEKLEGSLDFTERSDLLSWMIDNMKETVITHFQSEGMYNDMGDRDRLSFISKLEQF